MYLLTMVLYDGAFNHTVQQISSHKKIQEQE